MLPSLAIAHSSGFLLRSLLKLPMVRFKNIGWESDYRLTNEKLYIVKRVLNVKLVLRNYGV